MVYYFSFADKSLHLPTTCFQGGCHTPHTPPFATALSGNTQCYHHVPLIILVVIAYTDKERPGCSKMQNMAPRKNSCGVSTLQKQKLLMARFRNRYRHTVIDYRSYQMSHCVSIPMIYPVQISRDKVTGT